MTSRTTDFNCPRCRKYLFSAYTYTMNKAERQTLDAKAESLCQCSPLAELAPNCEHQWKVMCQGVQWMDCRCEHCGESKRETWD